MAVTMCPAPGQITVILCIRRAATSQPGRIAANLAPGKISDSDCVPYFTSFVRRMSTSQELPQIYLSGGRSKSMLQQRCAARGKYTECLKYVFAQILDWFYANTRNASVKKIHHLYCSTTLLCYLLIKLYIK